MAEKTLNPKPYTLNPKKGFTLIEMLVTLSVMIVLTSILILYSRGSEQQLILFKEQAKIITVIYRARSLAVQTYAEEGGQACGYGVHFDQVDQGESTFNIFKLGCGNPEGIYTEREVFEVNNLDDKLEFSELGLDDILFIPPDPKVVLIENEFELTGAEDRLIIISTIKGDSDITLLVTRGGQVTMQLQK